MNREQWLNDAAQTLTARFLPDHDLPTIQVSCGWPSKGALARKKRRIGECWGAEASADQATFNIFISPCLNDPTEVLHVLLHEMLHAIAGVKAGHKGAFQKLAKAVGLVKPWTATTPSPELREQLDATAAGLGEYPHSSLDKTHGPAKKQTTRMVKVICPDCDYTVRTTRKWIEVGLPTCHCGAAMVAADLEEDPDNGDV